MKSIQVPILLVLTLLAAPVLAGTEGLPTDFELIANRASFTFDGLGPGLNLGKSNVVSPASDFTIQAWVNLGAYCNDSGSGSGPTCDMSIVDKMASVESVNNHGWRLLKQSDGHFWFCLGGGPDNGCDGSVSTTVISRTVAVTGLWYSVTAVKTARQIAIYVNGALEGTSPLAGSFTSSDTPMLVGGNSFEGAYLIGQVGQVELLKSALSAPIIRAAFELSKGKYGY